MKWLTVAPEQALGKILCHNIADTQGHKALHKGAWLGDNDLSVLRMLGIKEVTVAALEPGDVHEDAAARRLAAACAGGGVTPNDASGGRVNLVAGEAGLAWQDPNYLPPRWQREPPATPLWPLDQYAQWARHISPLAGTPPGRYTTPPTRCSR